MKTIKSSDCPVYNTNIVASVGTSQVGWFAILLLLDFNGAS